MKFVLKMNVFLAGLFAALAAIGTLALVVLAFNGTVRGEAANQIGDAVFLLFMPTVGFALVSALIATAVWVLDQSGGPRA